MNGYFRTMVTRLVCLLLTPTMSSVTGIQQDSKKKKTRTSHCGFIQGGLIMSVTQVEAITSLLTPETLLKGRWEPLKKIGGGGFGEIYKARDRETNNVSLARSVSEFF